MEHNRFKTGFAERIFQLKYSQGGSDTWDALCERLVEDVCGSRNGTERVLMSEGDRKQLVEYMKQMKIIPGGRYLYYAGRQAKYYNNCYLLKAEEDTREEWANVAYRAMSCLSSGGGIGVDYSVLRPAGRLLKRTGGIASGPIPLMRAINEIGREVMQGGSRRSAIYASLNWQHEDIPLFLKVKNWSEKLVAMKAEDFNFPAPLDMTNISVNYDDAALVFDPIAEATGHPEASFSFNAKNPVFLENCKQAMMTGEPGFSFNFGDKQNETLRNACVIGTTPVLTKLGYIPIEELVGKKIEVWNGTEWSVVQPYSTGTKTVYDLVLSNGQHLSCTDNHEFVLEGGARQRLEFLEERDILSRCPIYPTVDLPYVKGKPYSQGFYSGDGNTGYEWSWVYSTKYSCLPRLEGSFSGHESHRRRWIHGPMLDKNYVPVNNDVAYCVSWLSGLMDADGTVLQNKNSVNVQVASIDRDFLSRIQLMCTRLGVCPSLTQSQLQRTTVIRGKFWECAPLYRLHFGAFDLKQLVSLGLKTERLNLSENNPQRDASRKLYIISKEYHSTEETYCFTEDKNHTGVFNGIYTGQCTEVTSSDDSDVCNLGSINVANVANLEELRSVVNLASKFLVCGTVRADLPYDKVYRVREQNRRLGLGLMGCHEWLLQRGSKYEVTPEFHKWLEVYRDESERAGNEHCDRLFISRPKAFRAIAPTGSIGILASTTTGIEPLFACAYKRRYLTDGTKWKYEYVIDATASRLIRDYSIAPETIDTAYKLSHDYERRIKFQADVQDYIDMSISSTINLPAWGSADNNESKIEKFARTLAKFSPRLRGFTAYPDGSRGGQPLTEVDYNEALKHKGVVYEESDICQITNRGGTCGA